MTVRNPLEKLKEKALDLTRRKWAGIRALAVGIDEFLKIRVQVLKHQVEEGLSGAGGRVLLINVLNTKKPHHIQRL